ncbi:hypothetical protein ACOTHJ_12620 [Achromobacter xylosoxidans]
MIRFVASKHLGAGLQALRHARAMFRMTPEQWLAADHRGLQTVLSPAAVHDASIALPVLAGVGLAFWALASAFPEGTTIFGILSLILAMTQWERLTCVIRDAQAWLEPVPLEPTLCARAVAQLRIPAVRSYRDQVLAGGRSLNGGDLAMMARIGAEHAIMDDGLLPVDRAPSERTVDRDFRTLHGLD